MKVTRASTGLSSIIGALIAIIILVNSVAIIERYSSYEINAISNHAKTVLPTMFRAYTVGDNGIVVYNGDNIKHKVLYIVTRNGSIKNSNIEVTPGQSIVCGSCKDAVALILEDSHIVYINNFSSYQAIGSDKCLRLLPIIQTEIGDTLGRVISYEIEPAINSILVREKYKQGKLGLQPLIKDLLSQGYKAEIAPLISNSSLLENYTIRIDGRAPQLIVNISDNRIQTSGTGRMVSYIKRVKSSYNGIRELSIYPVEYNDGSVLSFDDEKYYIEYNLSFSYYMRSIELYLNNELYDTIRKNSYSTINRNIKIIIRRYNLTHLSFFLSDSEINYTAILPIGNLAIRWNGKNNIQEQVLVKITPDLIINLNIQKEYYFKVKGDSKGFVKTKVSVYPYSIYIYNDNIITLEGDFKLEGKGSIFYDHAINKSIIAEYVYSYPTDIKVILSSYIAILSLYYTGYSYDGLLYIHPLISTTPILELYHNTTDNTLQANLYIHNKSVTGIFKMLYGFRSLYIYTPDSYKGYLMYNYINPAGNVQLYYPRLLETGNIVLSKEIFQITSKTVISLNQYKVIEGNITSVKICINGITGILEAKGDPWSKFLLVIPKNYHLLPSPYASIGDNYAILTIPQSGTLSINMTIESAIPPR